MAVKLTKNEEIILLIIEQQKKRIELKYGKWCADHANYGWCTDTENMSVMTKIYRQNDYPVFVCSENIEMPGGGGMIVNEWGEIK